jgi:hydroxymethylbilane synthase
MRIGTRGSALALAQADWVAQRLTGEVEIVPITTAGDRQRAVGDKSRWVSELEQALLEDRIDLAVHSAKDVPADLADGLELVAIPQRADPRDAICGAPSLQALHSGARVGTSSLRRAAQIGAVRDDLEVVEIRGNVDTRLRKLDEGVVDATLLALAGLKRLGLTHALTSIFSTEEFLPAVGQGIVAIETRANDSATRTLLDAIDHAETGTALAAERAFLAVLDGSCRTPIAGHAVIAQGRLRLRGLIAKPDGSESFECMREGPAGDAVALGHDAGAELKRRAPADFLTAV